MSVYFSLDHIFFSIIILYSMTTVTDNFCLKAYDRCVSSMKQNSIKMTVDISKTMNETFGCIYMKKMNEGGKKNPSELNCSLSKDKDELSCSHKNSVKVCHIWLLFETLESLTDTSITEKNSLLAEMRNALKYVKKNTIHSKQNVTENCILNEDIVKETRMLDPRNTTDQTGEWTAMSGLKKIDWSRSTLKCPNNIIKEVFVLLPQSVESIMCNHCKLQDYHLTEFNYISHLKNLTKLHLNSNNFSQLPTFSTEFKKIVKLKQLSLSDNNITRLNEEFLENLELLDLDLADNEITKIPNDFFRKQHTAVLLRKLNLKGNKITSVKHNDFSSHHLEILDLSSNQLEKLPNQFLKELPKLRELYLRENNFKIDSLTETLSNSSNNLEVIDLSYNKIEMLTGSLMEELPKIRRLYLQNNNISHIDPSAMFHYSLEILNLSYNKIGQIPTEIFSMSKLRELYLQNNEIKSIPNSLKIQNELEILDLSHNDIRNFSVNFLQKLPGLKKLYLQQNKINVILNHQTTSLSKHALEVLDLQNNSISDIQPLTTYTSQLHYLTQVNLSYNDIHSILEFSAKSDFTLSIMGNNLSCDEGIAWIKEASFKIELNPEDSSCKWLQIYTSLPWESTSEIITHSETATRQKRQTSNDGTISSENHEHSQSSYQSYNISEQGSRQSVVSSTTGETPQSDGSTGDYHEPTKQPEISKQSTEMSTANQRTELTIAEQGTQLTTGDQSTELTTDDQSTQLATDDQSAELTTDYQSAELTTDDQSAELTTDDQSIKLTTDNKHTPPAPVIRQSIQQVSIMTTVDTGNTEEVSKLPLNNTTNAQTTQNPSSLLLNKTLNTKTTEMHTTFSLKNIQKAVTTENSSSLSINNTEKPTTISTELQNTQKISKKKNWIQKSLVQKLKRKQLSKTALRSLLSYYRAPVEAPAAAFIGTGALIFIIVEVVVIVLSDIPHLVDGAKQRFRKKIIRLQRRQVTVRRK